PYTLADALLARRAALRQRRRRLGEEEPLRLRVLGVRRDRVVVDAELGQRVAAVVVAEVTRAPEKRPPRRDPTPERLPRVALQPPLRRVAAIVDEELGEHLL